ncbi:MAG: hypothetical protein J6S78_06750 [Lachnospiraceae bacterium]|nr:hypothetical protein [Lachnospiraceae bacterium]
MDYFRLESNREEIFSLLKERCDVLEKLLNDLARNHYKHPGGALKTCRRKKAFQYYWQEEGSERWQYLSGKRKTIAERIVNAEYYEQIQAQAEQEIKEIKRFLLRNRLAGMENCFDSLSDARKAIVKRIIPTEENVIKDFLSEQYLPARHHEENMQYKTSQGEMVRSKAEWMIAERLHNCGIPYQYEFPLHLNGIGTIRPDFRCLNVRKRKVIFWEHLGMMGDYEYANSALRKIDAYEENGYHVGENLIVTEEASEYSLLPKAIDRWINRMLL